MKSKYQTTTRWNCMVASYRRHKAKQLLGYSLANAQCSIVAFNMFMISFILMPIGSKLNAVFGLVL